MRSFFAVFAVLFAGLTVQASAQSCTGLCLYQTCSDSTTTLSGTVYTPNQVDPLPNVVVFIPNAPLPAFSSAVECVPPGSPVGGSPLVGTISDYMGKFTLTNVPVGVDFPLVIQAGRWRAKITIPAISSCGSTTDGIKISFPTTQTAGDTDNNIPLIAVSTGSVDSAECVLRKVGINDKEFTNPGGGGRIQLFAGSRSTGATGTVTASSPKVNETQLIGSTAGTTQLNNYDMVMFPCQGGVPGVLTASTASANAAYSNLSSYVNNGGRVFATHWSEGWLNTSGTVTSPFQSTATWTAGDSISGSFPATVNTTFTDASTIADWLKYIGVTPVRALIPELDNNFYNVSAVNSTYSQVWLTLNDTTTPAYNHAIMQFTFNTPLTASASAQCGRVLYNDYHVETPLSNDGVFPHECKTTAMTAQEKLLEYSLFDLSSFITPTVPPTISVDFSNSPPSFTQADTGDVVTINVNNTSTASPSGPSLTLKVTLPAGLAATAMQDASGTGGWLCNASSLTCTRITGLDAATTASIALTLSVSPAMPVGSTTITAVVSGGGLAANVTGMDTVHVYGLPVITWPTPAAINYPTPLSSTQLNATANVAGSFVYTPDAPTVLNPGSQTLSVTFTATDTVNYPTPAHKSVTLVVNFLTQAITFAALPTPVTYGAVTTMTLSATGGASGNPVTFSVTGPATVSGNTLTITGAGTVTVTANQAGDTYYAPATPVSHAVVVNQAAQTINFTPPPASVTYGIPPITLNATASSGLPVTFSVLSGPATVSGNTLTIIAGGATVVVAANQPGNANYLAAPQVTYNIQVAKIPTTISLSSTASTLFIRNPLTLTAHVAAPLGTPTGTVTFTTDTGTVLGTVALSSTGVATLTTAIGTVGSYVIHADYSGNSGYDVSTATPVAETLMDFTVIATGVTALNVEHGTTVSYTYAIIPVGGTAMPQDIHFALDGFPAASVLSFTPQPLTAGTAGTSTVTLTVKTPDYPTGPASAKNKGYAPVLACVGLGVLLLPLSRRVRSKPMRRLAGVVLLLAGMGAMTSLQGCGTGWQHEDFTITMSATSINLAHYAVTTLRVH